MYTVTRDLKTFSAAHRLNKGYEGKCKTLHGHSYRVSVTLTAHHLDQHGFVIDFGEIKRLFDTWVQKNWDHVTIVSERDLALLEFLKADDQDYFLFPGGENTTCEAMGRFLFDTFNAILNEQQDNYANQVSLVSVNISESNYSHACYSQ